MSSERQIRANRLNAKQSTGPSSSDGKARVASNPLKHGLTAKRIVLPSESAEEFEAFRIALWMTSIQRGHWRRCWPKRS